MTRTRKLAIGLGAPSVLLAAGMFALNDEIEGASFVIQAAGMTGPARSIAEWTTAPIVERDVRIPWRGGDLPGRWYLPESGGERPLLVVPGVHAAGIDEPRLVGFARDIAGMGHPVLTAELADLRRYSVTARATDMTEDAALWLAQQREVATDGRIGMMGISFAGGLAIVAASRPALRDRVALVMSFGGHGDLPRTLRYLCTGVQPDGATRPPHDYGVAIILLGVAKRVVPAGQTGPLGDAIVAFLQASHVDMVDKKKGAEAFAHAAEMAEALPEPARTLMGYVNARDVAKLGPILLPHVTEMGGDPALSPARSAPPSAVVYLLHGADDNVIPAVESVLLSEHLRGQGVEVHQLSTALITHAEVDRSKSLPALWRLVRFWGDLLDE